MKPGRRSAPNLLSKDEADRGEYRKAPEFLRR